MKANNILGLRTTIYKVGNLDNAKEWYSKAFGVKPYFDEPYYVGFNIAGYELGLQPEGETDTIKGESIISYWGVKDVKEIFEHLLNLGATEHESPRNVGGEIIVASIKDPWENTIGFIYNPEFKLRL